MSDKVPSADNQQGRLNEKLTPEYIVGVVDGEGYFSVSATVNRSQGYDLHNVKVVFGIKLNEEDGQILYLIKDWFGCGQVRFREDKRKNFSNCLEYQVRDTESITKVIIPFFRKYPLKFPKKKRAFTKFIEITEMKNRKDHIGEKGFTKVQYLARQLHI